MWKTNTGLPDVRDALQAVSKSACHFTFPGSTFGLTGSAGAAAGSLLDASTFSVGRSICFLPRSWPMATAAASMVAPARPPHRPCHNRFLITFLPPQDADFVFA